MKHAAILPVATVFASAWIMLATGVTAVRLTEKVGVFGLVMVPAAIVASLLVVYFDWRARLMRGVRAERDAHDVSRSRPKEMIARARRRPAEPHDTEDETIDVRRSDVIDVSRPAHSERTFAGALVSLIGAAGLALLLPLVVLAVGTPVALVVRGVLEAAEWALAFNR